MAGKTANLQFVHRCLPDDNRGNMISLATGDDRTLFFDFLPVSASTVRGFTTKFQLYTVPGQTRYNMTRKLVLRGVDGVVFVADSQWDRLKENVESLRNLGENLREYRLDLATLPYVIQYNKRDLPEVAPIDYLEYTLNRGARRVPAFEAVAVTGQGSSTRSTPSPGWSSSGNSARCRKEPRDATRPCDPRSRRGADRRRTGT